MLATTPLDDAGSFAWMANPDEPYQRASAALVTAGGVLVVDPVDAPGLDRALAAAGRPAAVVTLLDRHARDGAAIAVRLDVPRLEPHELGGAGLGADVEVRTVFDSRRWRESLLWLPGLQLLVCMETLGTLDFFRARAGDPLGVHPLARPLVPRRAFTGLTPRTIACGHGWPLAEGATDAMRWVIRDARRDLPRHWLRLARLGVQARRRRS